MSLLLFFPTFPALSYSINTNKLQLGVSFALFCFKLYVGKMTQWNSCFCGYSVFEMDLSVDYTIHHALNTISEDSILLP